MCRFRPRAPARSFHVPVALPPRAASRRFFARRRYPRFPSHSLAVVRGYSEDAYLRARPRPRNLGTRLEWIRITLLWARRRLPTSATTNDAQAHHVERPILVRESKEPRFLRALAFARDASRRPFTAPRDAVLALALELSSRRSARWVPRRPTSHAHRISFPSFLGGYFAGRVGRERPSKGLACYGERPSSNIPRAPGSPIPSFREVRSLLSSW